MAADRKTDWTLNGNRLLKELHSIKREIAFATVLTDMQKKFLAKKKTIAPNTMYTPIPSNRGNKLGVIAV